MSRAFDCRANLQAVPGLSVISDDSIPQDKVAERLASGSMADELPLDVYKLIDDQGKRLPPSSATNDHSSSKLQAATAHENGYADQIPPTRVEEHRARPLEAPSLARHISSSELPPRCEDDTLSNTSSQTSHLLRLPAELRLLIYSYAFESPRYAEYHAACRERLHARGDVIDRCCRACRTVQTRSLEHLGPCHLTLTGSELLVVTPGYDLQPWDAETRKLRLRLQTHLPAARQRTALLATCRLVSKEAIDVLYDITLFITDLKLSSATHYPPAYNNHILTRSQASSATAMRMLTRIRHHDLKISIRTVDDLFDVSEFLTHKITPAHTFLSATLDFSQAKGNIVIRPSRDTWYMFTNALAYIEVQSDLLVQAYPRWLNPKTEWFCRLFRAMKGRCRMKNIDWSDGWLCVAEY